MAKLEEKLREVAKQHIKCSGCVDENKCNKTLVMCNELQIKAVAAAVREAGMVELAENQELPPIDKHWQGRIPTDMVGDMTAAAYYHAMDVNYSCAQKDMLTPVPIGNGKQTRFVKIVEDVPVKVKITGEGK